MPNPIHKQRPHSGSIYKFLFPRWDCYSYPIAFSEASIERASILDIIPASNMALPRSANANALSVLMPATKITLVDYDQ